MTERIRIQFLQCNSFVRTVATKLEGIFEVLASHVALYKLGLYYLCSSLCCLKEMKVYHVKICLDINRGEDIALL